MKRITANGGMRVKDFSIKHTFESAQPLTFHADYNEREGTLSYVNYDSLIRARFSDGAAACRISVDPENSTKIERELASRFRLGDNMDRIYQNISTDSFMESAIRQYRGMRITLNDPWETTLCFILSQYNNVKRIRLIVQRFIAEFGPEIRDGDGIAIAKGFPTSERLTEYSEAEFRKAGAGFRARYVANAADFCTNNLNLHKLRGKRYPDLKEALMEISGVGDKVADCIALMGYGSMEAFPIDVWVKRTLEQLYFNSREKSVKELHRFAEERWGDYMGYAQQYLFHSSRDNNLTVIESNSIGASG